MSNTQAQENASPKQTESTVSRGDRSAALARAHLALEVALDKKAIEPMLLEVGELCSYAEFVLLLSGRSDRQVDAIAEAIMSELKANGHPALGVEGVGSGQWVLVDFGDLVIHVFHHPLRQHYDLESLWIDAPRIELDIPDEARAGADDYYETP